MAEPTTHADLDSRWRGALATWGRRSGWVSLVTVLALLGAWLGLLLGGTEHQEVGPFETTMSVRPSLQAGTTVATPPLGELRLATHDAPLRLTVRVAGIDAEKARRIAANPATLAGLEDRAVADIRSGLVDMVVRAGLAAVLGAAVLALLVVRRVRAAVLAVAVAVAGLGAGAYATWSTWNPRAIQEPRYTGLLTSAPTVVGSARDIVQDFTRYRQQLTRLIGNVSSLYSTTSTLPVVQHEQDVTKVLHVSDLELAPQAWDVIATVAHQYDVDVVVDSGDTTDHGSSPENAYLEEVRRLDVPYVWVRGNHDSMATQRAMRRLPGVVVLDGRARTVEGIRFLGVGDPRFTPDKSTVGGDDSTEEGLEAVHAEAERLSEVARQEGAVDLVVQHDPRAAEAFDGLADAVLSGHLHNHRVQQLPEGTWQIQEGSTGGSGLRALEGGDGPAPIELSVLYLDRETAELRAWDHLTLGGLGAASANIEREVVDTEE
jgi:predicted MPP superfamily phosphohydrolase